MIIKKSLFVFILFVLLLASCSRSAETGDIKTATGEEPPPQDNTQEPAEIRDSLPDNLDFNGAVLNLHVRGDCNIDIEVPEFGVEAEIGEIINDVLYNRDKAVEDRLNLKLNVIKGQNWQDYDQAVRTIRVSIAAGDNSYDLVAGWSARIPSLSVEGLLQNLRELPHLNLTEPWWNRIMAEELTINRQLHFAVGDGNVSLLANCMVLFANNKIQQEYGLQNLYDVVLGGKWTIDYMSELVRGVSKDLNGDGVMDGNDLYGLYIYEANRTDSFLQSSNIKMTFIDEEGLPYLDMEYEKIANIVDKVYSLIFENEGSYVTKDFWVYDIEIFKKNQILLSSGQLIIANQNLRDMEADYSIIPYPKYDEAQEQYYTRIQDGVSLFCVPVNCGSPEMVGAFMEAVASETYRNVSSAYFDVAMKIKYARDEYSAQMLDIIRDGAYLNFAGVYNESIGNPWFVMRELMSSKSKNFASWHDKNAPRITQAIEKLIDKME